MIFPKKSLYYLHCIQIEMFDQHWHLYILPIDHQESIQSLEDEVWEEVRNFMKCLVAAFDSINMEAVFFENAYKFSDVPHCILECVAVPYANLKEAKLDVYFRQGMEDLDGFWSTHKKIIKLTKEQGGIRKQIPKGFPYFYVDFATSHGFAHVIENEKYFDKNFARQILGNVLRVEKNKVVAPKNFEEQEIAERKQKFLTFWKKFDWTTVIKKQQEQ